MKITVLAFDFGASSGRAIRATFDGKLTYEEIHRFENNPIQKEGYLCWDFDDLMANVRFGIKKAKEIDSIGFDTWGIDFGLIDANGKLLTNPVHYRDTRTEGVLKKAFRNMSDVELYAETGNQIMDFNTLFQLLAADLNGAQKLLFMPDLFAYMLCGNAVCEESGASTSQMFNPVTKKWSQEVLSTFKIPPKLFAQSVSAGTVIGSFDGAKVIAVAGHDTQCAVAAMPTNKENVAFLSCGTWSLLGTELDAPVLTERSMHLGLSNEIGANGKINYLKNIVGLWLIQESRREWLRQGQEYSYTELEQLALEAGALKCYIDPDASEFMLPGDIPARVQEFCQKSGQYVPRTVGEIMRCIYESLALKYRYAVEQLQEMVGKTFEILHIVGGGTKSSLLCQMAANSCNIPVVAGPVEATALGNVIIQLVALGALPDISAGRELIAQTEHLQTYMPQDVYEWDVAMKFYREIVR